MVLMKIWMNDLEKILYGIEAKLLEKYINTRKNFEEINLNYFNQI